MPRDYRLYLDDILTAIAKIERYLGSADFATFCEDEMRIDAVVRNLEIVARHPAPARRRRAARPWRGAPQRVR